MTDDASRRLASLEAMFHELTPLPTNERTRRLESIRADDAELAVQLDALLEASRDAGFLAASALDDYGVPKELDPSADPIPERLGRYRVLGLLGEGGMGRVYRAIDPGLGREVAIKVLPGVSLGADGEERLAREARLLARVKHAGIAVPYALDHDDEGRPFLVLELVEGPTLAERLDRGPLTVDEVIHVGHSLARALEAAHAVGVLHLDLKPANVKLTDDNEPKVLDFGIARLHTAKEADGKKRPSHGTPGYASPEQLGGAPVDERSDLFSLGVILYELSTGAPAFPGTDTRTRVLATMRGAPALPASVELPEPLPQLITDLLATTPEDRPRSALEVRRTLDELRVLRAHAELMTPARRRAPVPRRTSEFVGRRAERSELAAALEQETLVTLLGAGGSGKTRLAQECVPEVVERSGAEAWWVSLISIGPDDDLPSAVASTLGARESSGQDPVDSIAMLLTDPRDVLVLDNAEHVVPAVRSFIEELRSRLPSLHILVTSRQPLHLEGEYPLGVRGLLPLAAEPENETDAERLFVARASEARPSFRPETRDRARIREICRRLDGSPLAIELAAARARHLPVSEIASRLDDRFSLLVAGGDSDTPHHRTLQETIDWSYRLLSEPERTLLRRLSVFSSAASLEAIEGVVPDAALPRESLLDTLTSLADRSLVELVFRSSGGEETVRYGLLESIRQYATERLEESGESAELLAQHRRHFRDHLQRSFAQFETFEDQKGALDALDREHSEILAAIASHEAEGDLDAACDMACNLWRLWEVRGYLSRGIDVLRRLVDRVDENESAETLRARLSLGFLLDARGEVERGVEVLERMAELSRGREDAHVLRAHALNELGTNFRRQGDYPRARASYEESLAVQRAEKNDRAIAGVLGNLGGLAEEMGDTEDAESLARESLEILRRMGDQRGISVQLNNLGVLAYSRGSFDEARGLYDESRQLREELGDHRGLSLALQNIGLTYLEEADPDRAEPVLLEALQISDGLDDRYGVASTRVSLGWVAGLRGDCARAADLLRTGLDGFFGLGQRTALSAILEVLGEVTLRAGLAGESAESIGISERMRNDLSVRTNSLTEARFDRLTAGIRARIGDEAAQASREAGRALPPELAESRVRAILSHLETAPQ